MTAIGGRFPREGVLCAPANSVFQDHNSECSALLVIAVRAWFNLRPRRAVDIYASP